MRAGSWTRAEGAPNFGNTRQLISSNHPPEDATMISSGRRVRIVLAIVASFAMLASPAGVRAQTSGKQAVAVPGATKNPNLSAAVRVGDLLFVSGQLGGNDSTIEGQTTQALEAMKKVLDAAG